MRKWLGSAVLLLVLAGCSSPDNPPTVPAPDAPGAAGQAPPAAKNAAALPASVPTEISIPKIGAKSSLIPLGLNADETIQVPSVDQPMQAGWYEKASTPGEAGPAVILGHVDGHKKPGIFFRLKEMAAGDEVLVSRQDGSTARFKVTRVEQISKKDFPTDAVYGDTVSPELRLITCGGVFDHTAKSYKDNIIVFASFVPGQA
ncbi:LPXTG-site transpeptidase (sortase) family protein [Kibdelosporangium banguiense]|uniref:LPXTG-site transpeptidase (Sortase) family protein n=1 Tax=Kibdelosporangium banguiense TaxID=1365924 RepID=A0ABS4TEC6_9PSEU|nr:class F sortase [Kibdelosporangium banguiense]MBP2322770.1 LPXTG-site transpeptidase (sortase) family protein [Kibdelosporangium banguiense]